MGSGQLPEHLVVAEKRLKWPENRRLGGTIRFFFGMGLAERGPLHVVDFLFPILLEFILILSPHDSCMSIRATLRIQPNYVFYFFIVFL